MFISPGTVDIHVNEHAAELLREAERERLASAVNRAEQSLRVRVAQRLRAAAEWIEGDALRLRRDGSTRVGVSVIAEASPIRRHGEPRTAPLRTDVYQLRPSIVSMRHTTDAAHGVEVAHHGGT